MKSMATHYIENQRGPIQANMFKWHPISLKSLALQFNMKEMTIRLYPSENDNIGNLP